MCLLIQGLLGVPASCRAIKFKPVKNSYQAIQMSQEGIVKGSYKEVESYEIQARWNLSVERFPVQQLHGPLPRGRTKMNRAHYESNSYLNEIFSPVLQSQVVFLSICSFMLI